MPAAEPAGNEGRAIVWFKHRTIPVFGRTAEELVEEGHADLMTDDLERMEAGAYS